MSAHTKGPWVASERGTIRSVNGDLIAKADDYGITEAERMANARLIAAAPELLEALRPIAEHGVISAKIIANAQVAIAKATGVTP